MGAFIKFPWPNGGDVVSVHSTVVAFHGLGFGFSCRFLSSVGYVKFVNIVGKAKIIFFSNDKSVGNLFQFWKWNKSIRFNRLFKKIL